MDSILPVVSTIQTVDRNLSSFSLDEKIFRSCWLCSDELKKTIFPLMEKIVSIEARDNHFRTNSFLPHITLFTGNHLSISDCENILTIFLNDFSEGLFLKIEKLEENPTANPPLQLIFTFHNESDRAGFCNLQHEALKKFGLSIDINPDWLHSTIIYNTAKRKLSWDSINYAREIVEPLIDQVFHFDKYAFTTGNAWNEMDIEKWRCVEGVSFNSN